MTATSACPVMPDRDVVQAFIDRGALIYDITCDALARLLNKGE